jgi:hypothetical protein
LLNISEKKAFSKVNYVLFDLGDLVIMMESYV